MQFILKAPEVPACRLGERARGRGLAGPPGSSQGFCHDAEDAILAGKLSVTKATRMSPGKKRGEYERQPEVADWEAE